MEPATRQFANQWAVHRNVVFGLLLTVVDVVWTMFGVRALGATELNPLLRHGFVLLGVDLTLLLRGVLGVALIAALGWAAIQRRSTLAPRLLEAAVLWLGLVALWNLSQAALVSLAPLVAAVVR